MSYSESWYINYDLLPLSVDHHSVVELIFFLFYIKPPYSMYIVHTAVYIYIFLCDVVYTAQLNLWCRQTFVPLIVYTVWFTVLGSW